MAGAGFVKFVIANQGNGRVPGELKHPKCDSCKKARNMGRHPLLVNQDHDQAVKIWKEPHVIQGARA